MSWTYLDYAATSPLLPEAAAKMHAVIDDLASSELGNPSALHSAGHRSSHIIEEARAEVARLLNADPTEIIFTSGGSEANNTITNIFAGQKIAVSSIEHPSLLESARVRAGSLAEIGVDQMGFVNIEEIPGDANLVSIMLANNELGSIEPIAKIVDRCRDKHTFVHSDATQAFGKIKIDVQSLGLDYLTVSAHKIGGPVGIGALYVRRDSPFRPLIIGGHQESKRRAGTSNVLLAAGFGAAAKWCWDNWSCKRWAAVAELRDELRARILEEAPHSSCNSPSENCLPNILNMSFAAAEGESIQLYLDAENIEVSTGSACASGDIKPSHVLMATRHDAEAAHSSIRFSLGLSTTRADIDRTMQHLPKIIQRLQGISTIKLPDYTKKEKNV